ncbi:hypothetical protein BXY66_1737 [Shimia isoporae]|uniref:Uncharacterized protein n=1 Tax=Shimia isoporae TaxID=647720 RepID=A0A4R1NPB2_9RHOB|nr:hypothetical protein [Shimia isoporae]TCL09681.1 hypothetical protein BXY66_1737 [Shimia isoporae]
MDEQRSTYDHVEHFNHWQVALLIDRDRTQSRWTRGVSSEKALPDWQGFSESYEG